MSLHPLREYLLVLRGLICKICLVHLDDSIVLVTNFNDHLSNLIVFTIHWQLNVKKCILLRQQVTFLGHVISSEGVVTDPEKVRESLVYTRLRNMRLVVSLVYVLHDLCNISEKSQKYLHNLSEKILRDTGLSAVI